MQLGHRLTWLLATVVGLTGLALATVVMRYAFPALPPEVPALVLLVPVTAASILSSWRVGLPLAALGALTFALVFLPPVGLIRIGFTDDVVILVTFVAVSVSFSVLVSRRSIATRAELIGHERMRLLRSVSHDVRSPLQTILAASTELQGGADYDPVARKQLLGLVIDETRRLDRIVDNLLSLSRLQAGALIPQREPVPVATVIERCQARFAVIANDGDRLEIEGAVPEMDVDVDAVQIDQVLTNLVENAVRHAPAPVSITIVACAAGPMVELRVCDDGPGFSPRARRDLFVPFRSEHGSSGLGLTLCKAIVEAHDGTLTVDDGGGNGDVHGDDRRRRGASIRFTMPVAR